MEKLSAANENFAPRPETKIEIDHAKLEALRHTLREHRLPQGYVASEEELALVQKARSDMSLADVVAEINGSTHEDWTKFPYFYFTLEKYWGDFQTAVEE